MDEHQFQAIRELSAKIDVLATQVAASNINVAELRTELRTELRVRNCPPGACQNTAEQLTRLMEATTKGFEQVHTRIDPLEEESQQRVGGTKMLVAAVGVASGVGAFLGWLVQTAISLKPSL